jgi:uncharacterized protein YjbJ (UPF0337 family)
MDKDRIAGSAKQIKGSIKEVAGKIVGDAKIEAEGKADKVEGKVQNAIGRGQGRPEEVGAGCRCLRIAAEMQAPRWPSTGLAT